MPKSLKYSKGSGNVFQDLKLKNPMERLFKAKIAIAIHEIIQSKGLTQKEAASLLGIDQPKISALSNGRLSGFTIDRLFRFLNALEQDIELTIRDRTLRKLPRKSYSIQMNVPKNGHKEATK